MENNRKYLLPGESIGKIPTREYGGVESLINQAMRFKTGHLPKNFAKKKLTRKINQGSAYEYVKNVERTIVDHLRVALENKGNAKGEAHRQRAIDLLNAGANPNIPYEYIDNEEYIREYPIHLAFKLLDLELLELLLEKGADVNVPYMHLSEHGNYSELSNIYIRYPIFLAIDSGRLDIVQLIVEKGVNFDLRDKRTTMNTPEYYEMDNGTYKYEYRGTHILDYIYFNGVHPAIRAYIESLGIEQNPDPHIGPYSDNIEANHPEIGNEYNFDPIFDDFEHIISIYNPIYMTRRTPRRTTRYKKSKKAKKGTKGRKTRGRSH
jgi:hypothetical protein